MPGSTALLRQTNMARRYLATGEQVMDTRTPSADGLILVKLRTSAADCEGQVRRTIWTRMKLTEYRASRLPLHVLPRQIYPL